MKQIVRIGVFETNSSNTHAITICPKVIFDKWILGSDVYLIDGWGRHPYLVEGEDGLKQEYEEYKKKYNPPYMDMNEWKKESVMTYVEYDYMRAERGLDDYSTSYTTPSGDEIVVFGVYGREG